MAAQFPSAQHGYSGSDFGANEWLVDELRQQYLHDPASVDRAWREFFNASTEPTTGTRAPEPYERVTGTDPDNDAVRLPDSSATTVADMTSSLSVPTATSVRRLPVKLLTENRVVLNDHLRRSKSDAVSLTHLIGFAMVKALTAMPEMNRGYAEKNGTAYAVRHRHVGLGVAAEQGRPDDSRQLVVPVVKEADTLDFREFWEAYEDVMRRSRSNELTPDDFSGCTATLMDLGPGGAVHSLPRLMAGQGLIISVGATDYPAEFQGASPQTLARLAVSQVATVTSTYDHRIIQGAQSGEFLHRMHCLLLGEEDFYQQIFDSLRIPYEPVRWTPDLATAGHGEMAKTSRVAGLINAYRVRGHLMADTDPLGGRQRRHPDLDILAHGLTLWDLDREFALTDFGDRPAMPLRDILGLLRQSYCGTIGVEYMHIQDPTERRWIQEKVEVSPAPLDRSEQLRILYRLNAAEAFETFLQTKYVGQKRYSLEGSESMIALLDGLLVRCAAAGVDEVVIGMAHRGRLNVLANIVGKSYSQIFREFEDMVDPGSVQGSGDVKYHLGAQGVFRAPDRTSVAVSVVANPSHLEIVGPVIQGVVRAKQDLRAGRNGEFPVLPVVIHGDAAFAGQGVVAETLNMSQLRGYRTGGTLHVVVNNQVGFTTLPANGRSSAEATDVARTVQAPILHVNGDDPEAVVHAARLAFDYRRAFGKDVVVDLICYRRHGHSEVDDPSITQPVMYDRIDAKTSVRTLYTRTLLDRGDIGEDDVERARQDYRGQLERVFAETRALSAPAVADAPPRPDAGKTAVPETAISEAAARRVLASQTDLPDGFTPHPRVLPQLERRTVVVDTGAIDWATGETLAIGTLLMDGVPVRLTGQDTRRGTFNQRHAVLIDRHTGAEHTPLATLGAEAGRFTPYDSLLSELAALGFEYGYSLARPDALVLWEAQFGDFVNGAQTVVDEYISSAEQKWGQRSGVVLLLPHGLEGQGPDHSSGRIERFLQLCAQDNMTVAVPTEPGNYFHLLRRQGLSGGHRPLVVFTPKSMLRLKAATSVLPEFTEGSFRPVIGDDRAAAGRVEQVLLCSGKVYYDLDRHRDADSAHTAIVRLEQLYPFPTDELRAELARYRADVHLRWVQEEPENQGAGDFVISRLARLGFGAADCVSRPEASAPAVGSAARHAEEQRELMRAAFG